MDTSGTTFGQVKQILGLEMAISIHETDLISVYFRHWLLDFDGPWLLKYPSNIRFEGTIRDMIFRSLIWYFVVLTVTNMLATDKKVGRNCEKSQKIDFQSTFIVRLGHFQTFNLFLLAKFSALCAPCEVFWWASSFLQVSGSFGHKKLEEIEKMAKNWFFRPHFKLSWSHQGVKNLI